MKIVFCGGGTGGHFYPLIAVAEELRAVMREEKLLEAQIYYLAPVPYSSKILFDHDITYKKIEAGKVRRYRSILNFFDLFKTGWGVIRALWKVFWIYPDVVFGKGGYMSFPVLFAAKLLKIPVIIHESDTVPGKVNLWAGKFARAIAISYPETASYFPKDKTVYTGNPIRKEIMIPATEGSFEFLNLQREVPTILILGGSQGAKIINERLLDCLAPLVENFQVIHQTGRKNIEEVKGRAKVILEKRPHPERYKPFDYLNDLALRMAAGASKLVISRSGSTLFEIAAWGLPSIMIPIPEKVSHDQRENAYAYARSGAAVVIEQENLTPEIMLSEIKRIMTNPEIYQKMQKAAKDFAKLDAAKKIAQEIIALGLEHQN
ncbi:MAG TPA: undecaprenyldiphospho-muramoylpentapeptide beta-N-acetylglucosaminyltransferase [Candidatus Paceibacterota bacterium]|nr:undecaprenyldiphospho-muramoylpentapeptide beta-N-acetylglucosaminyltransferase [Candidatus Paceibacterota bacterium]